MVIPCKKKRQKSDFGLFQLQTGLTPECTGGANLRNSLSWLYVDTLLKMANLVVLGETERD